MVHVSDGDIGASGFVFYDDLDTVRFAASLPEKEASLRDLSATGNVMLGLIVDDIAPVLSQSQALDNSLLLTLMAAEGDRVSRDDRQAFFELLRAGFVRVGIMDQGLSDDPPDGERHTLLNAFRTSLKNSQFVLSGWPELRDQELRLAVLDYLDHDRSQLGTVVDRHLEARVDGLLELDRNLRATPQALKFIPGPAGDPLDARVMSVAGSLETDGEPVRKAASVITGHAVRHNISLKSRSNWYRLIDEHTADLDSRHTSAYSALREIVDGSYNMQVSESLRDDGTCLSPKYGNVADDLARRLTPGLTPGMTWAEVLPQGGDNLLRWSAIPELLREFQVLSPQARLRELERRRIEAVAVYRTEHGWASSIRIALPWTTLSSSVAMASGLITDVSPGRAAIATALTGIVTLVSGTPVAKAFSRRRLAREEQRLMESADERHAIRAGAAGWLDGIRGHDG
jgi:hypothetical protein